MCQDKSLPHVINLVIKQLGRGLGTMYLPLYIALLFIYIRILNRFLCIVLYSTQKLNGYK